MTQSKRLQPSVNNANERVGRAKEHLARLKRELTIFRRSHTPPTIYFDPEIGGTASIERPGRPIPPRISILVGEIVYNLRAALDYLVYELAILDSGEVQERTQFPIETTEQGWRSRWKSIDRKGKSRQTDRAYWLRGLSLRHKAAIRFLQPRYGCNWTRRLRDISNPDKHRTLTVIPVRQTSVRREEGVGRPVVIDPSREGRRVLFYASNRPSSHPVDMNIENTVYVAFDDGAPIVKTLQELHTQVADVIEAFEPEFEAVRPASASS